MSPRNKYESPFDRKARKIGLLLTVVFHAALLFVCFGAGLKYIYPPPAEQGILMEFVPDEPKPIQVKTGVEPRAKKADPDKEVRLVQKSESQQVGENENRSAETTIGPEGDVPVPEPPRPKPIDRRALFASSKNKQDTIAPQASDKISDRLKGGHPDGNTQVGSTDGTPSARLEGRTVMGNLPIPEYGVEQAGRVVVRILVDQYGTVTRAVAGEKGTTVTNSVLWKAAEKAALQAKFNISENAPAVQEGTITYVFTLK